jgi:hypothetical protein
VATNSVANSHVDHGYVLSKGFFFFNLFTLCLFSCFYVFLSILCVLCFRIALCIVSPYAYSYLYYICVQFYRPPPPGGNPVAVNKCHIISYQK